MPDVIKALDGTPAEGAADFRGPYGYGRPAHMSDPAATYAFEPDPNRALQPRGEMDILEEPSTAGEA